MSKLVWIFGPTAVGKDTLIRSMVSLPTQHPLISTLELKGPIIANESALLLRQEARTAMISSIAQDAANAETVLIKGQGFDITNGRNIPSELETLLPNNEHVYVYLDASAEALKERREERGEQNSVDDANARLDMLRIAKEFEAAGFFVRWFNNDKNDMPVQRLPPDGVS